MVNIHTTLPKQEKLESSGLTDKLTPKGLSGKLSCFAAVFWLDVNIHLREGNADL